MINRFMMYNINIDCRSIKQEVLVLCREILIESLYSGKRKGHINGSSNLPTGTNDRTPQVRMFNSIKTSFRV